jgi:hypothetical protein
MSRRNLAADLEKKLSSFEEWPPRDETKLLRQLYTYIALRESEPEFLLPDGWPDGKRFMIDPLPSRIAEAKADLIFGEEPEFTAAKKSDQGLLEDILNGNKMTDELLSAAELTVSEGLGYWRLKVDKEISDVPIIEWHSRTAVYPYYRGRHLAALAFISVIEEDKEAWRYVTIHAEGIVLNRLFKVPQSGTRTTERIAGRETTLPVSTQSGKPFGEPVSLTDRPETEDLPNEWEHDLPTMAAGEIRNRTGSRNKKIGISDYKRVLDLFFSLNLCTTIGHSNMRLSAKKRAVVDRSALTVPAGNGQPTESGAPNPSPPSFDPEEELFVADQLDAGLGEEKPGPFKILEYEFDAQNLILWDTHLEDKILVRTRTAPQLVGRHTEGAQTGPALRARLIDSILDASGKGRAWDDVVPNQALVAAQMVDKLPEGQGGFGRGWTDAETAPTMKRTSYLPEDEDARTLRITTETGAGLKSIQTGIEENNPAWDEERVDEELQRLRDEEGGPAQPPPPEGEPVPPGEEDPNAQS